MKIQISTDYAIRILHYLDTHKGMHTATDIADAIDITYPFFIKIANRLKKQGLLSSVQGRNGGYMLGKLAHEISLYDVFMCVEGELQISHCIQKGVPCTQGKSRNCKLHKAWHTLQSKMIEEMSTQYIADLAS